MKWKYILFSIIYILSFTESINAQAKIVVSLFEDTSATLTAKEVKSIYHQQQFKKLSEATFNPGYTESIFWLGISPKNWPLNQEWLLAIDNPHINLLEYYWANDEGTQLLYKTGDFLPFKQRPFPEYTSYVFPLRKTDGIYLLKVDKRKESLQLPMRIVSYQELAATAMNGNLINGLLSGTIITLIFFSAVLWLSTHKKLYLYYSLYIASLLLWIWANKGLGFEYLWPNSSFLPSRARPTTLLLNIIFSIQFLQLFIGQTKNSFFYYPAKFLQALCMVALVVVLWPIDYEKSLITFKNVQIYIIVIATLQVIVILGSVIEKIIQGVKEAKFYLAAILVLALSGLAEQLYIYGSIILNYYVAQYALLGGLAIEAAILIYGLAQKFNRYRKERESLLFEKNEQQKTLTNTIVTVQEKERKLFADRLHDEIGSMLSVIGLHLHTLNKGIASPKNHLQHNLQQADDMLAQVASTVRSMSHQISPVTIDKLGFVKALESLVQTINQAEKLYIEFICLGFGKMEDYPPNYLNSIYRIIQELLQNMIKHAEASNGIIQLIEHEDMIAIMAEDNGKGLTPERMNNPLGSGMNSILSKIAYLQGTIEIEATGKGTLINIELPNPKNTLSNEQN
ncbi:sensor histidine kinase [Pedobacter sp.]